MAVQETEIEMKISANEKELKTLVIKANQTKVRHYCRRALYVYATATTQDCFLKTIYHLFLGQWESTRLMIMRSRVQILTYAILVNYSVIFLATITKIWRENRSLKDTL